LDELSVVVPTARADGEDAAALRLLLRGIRKHDAARRRFLLFEDLDDEAVTKWLQVHSEPPDCLLSDCFLALSPRECRRHCTVGTPAEQVPTVSIAPCHSLSGTSRTTWRTSAPCSTALQTWSSGRRPSRSSSRSPACPISRSHPATAFPTATRTGRRRRSTWWCGGVGG